MINFFDSLKWLKNDNTHTSWFGRIFKNTLLKLLKMYLFIKSNLFIVVDTSIWSRQVNLLFYIYDISSHICIIDIKKQIHLSTPYRGVNNNLQGQ